MQQLLSTVASSAASDVDPERVWAEWHLVDGVLERGPGERLGAAYEIPRGRTAATPA